ncbi:Ku70-binding protein [Klebsormidium nitens]|uniref:Mitochondrial inner membrane protease ATP23 n=1 Tax=Klebsormidium nitens TaxID=105231 RepID=A0A1Y1IEA2_KLENI|nr:Ku70-binding protein [Klebsormidium nitens]|eukprot:GAQ88292.1 Ku70-binding protein [Klebsormidium nitens]
MADASTTSTTTSTSGRRLENGRVLYGTTKEHCESMIEHSLKHNNVIKFLREAMEKAGCPVGDRFFSAMNCMMNAGGGFMPEGEGIKICYNNVVYQDEVDTGLAHELIHAYDQCRVAKLDWENVHHQACSEIRAANLSGDCHFKREIARGNFNIQKQHQVCVRRRAVLSVATNPNCTSKQAAEDAVDAVWAKCYKDTAPFDRIP